MRVALIHDYLTQFGGGERVLKSLSEIFPLAPIYTLVYNKKKVGNIFSSKKIHTSFLQKLPFSKTHHRIYPSLMPFAIEQFDLSKYDLVISDSASYAKGVLTGPETLHISYCHTPLRYAWDDSHRYIREFGLNPLARFLSPFALNYIRIWDRIASFRVDEFIANSFFVKSRIKKYYQRDAEVIYPPVDTDFYQINPSSSKQDYYLIVSRLLSYKKIDIAIEAFNKLKLPLKIVGEGPEEKHLKKISGPTIEFLGRLSDKKTREYYQNCLAFVFPQEEDFGIAPVEAMASGRPVIAYQGGGALESVKEGVSGLFFDEQTSEHLIKAIDRFKNYSFEPAKIREEAKRFDKKVFEKNIKEFIMKKWSEFKSKDNR